MGILAVFDMAGVDVGVKVRRANPDHVPPDDPTFYRASQLLFDKDWLGQKSGKGYYRYEPGSRDRLPHDEALELLRRARAASSASHAARAITRQEIVERCIFAMINEGARILEEGVALRPADIDVVYTSGYGFPRRRGGPMFYADQIGLDTVLAGLQEVRQGSAQRGLRAFGTAEEARRVGQHVRRLGRIARQLSDVHALYLVATGTRVGGGLRQ